MLTGVYVPAPGCWEITREYDGNKLSFVVWVEPSKSTESDPGRWLRISIGCKPVIVKTLLGGQRTDLCTAQPNNQSG